MAVVWKVETYCASPPEHPQQHPSSPPWGHQSTSSQERTLWGPQVGFASLGSSLAGWWAGPCLQGWWPPLVSPLGRGAGSCCPQGVASWPASGLGLREGGSTWGEVRQEQAASWRPPCAAPTCPVTWARLPTCLHRFLISCRTRCPGVTPGVPPGSRPCKACRLCSRLGQSHTCEVCVNPIPCCRVPITSCRGARPAGTAVSVLEFVF